MSVIYPDGAAPAAPATEFFGRMRELACLDDLLRSGSGRLITLVGPGGIGKTGLAAEAMRRVHRAEPDRPVYWARLAELERDCGECAATVLRSVCGPISATPTPLDVAVGPPAGVIAEHAILVLDNCEHVLAAAARGHRAARRHARSHPAGHQPRAHRLGRRVHPRRAAAVGLRIAAAVPAACRTHRMPRARRSGPARAGAPDLPRSRCCCGACRSSRPDTKPTGSCRSATESNCPLS
ncbi:AAA family ATPase [Nocardia sp. NPDC002869]|uniref:ATP-binding protein n=1 Tax=Nocardia sp. NPDC002869 TaxID=3161032 RepID=UPI00398CABD7